MASSGETQPLFRTPPSLDLNSASGILLWAVRGTTDGLTVQSRFGEVARGGGLTEVPVVRERDYRVSLPYLHELRLLRVPVPPNTRVTLRLWALGDLGAVTAPAKLQPAQTAPGEPYFAAADVTGLVKDGNDVSITTGNAVPIWAMLSVTDNATQHVTVITPQ